MDFLKNKDKRLVDYLIKTGQMTQDEAKKQEEAEKDLSSQADKIPFEQIAQADHSSHTDESDEDSSE